jgi:hypothetical protein
VKAINLEKKIFVGLIVSIGAIIVIASLVFWRKARKDQDDLKSGVVVNQTKEQENSSKSSEIKIGKPTTKSSSGAVEIAWELLYELDYKTGKMPDKLRALDKKRIRIPGFIVPLSDDISALKEFLLVPNAQACIHVPPPPPNLILYSILDKSVPMEKIKNPSWVEGTLSIETMKSEYGDASYKLSVDKIEEYKF